jgi:hypothetical protein
VRLEELEESEGTGIGNEGLSGREGGEGGKRGSGQWVWGEAKLYVIVKWKLGAAEAEGPQQNNAEARRFPSFPLEGGGLCFVSPSPGFNRHSGVRAKSDRSGVRTRAYE